MVQREEELTAVGRLLDGVTGGGGGVALLERPAGIGKTALLGAVVVRAEEIGLGGVVCAWWRARARFAQGDDVPQDLLGAVNKRHRWLGRE